MFKQCYKYIYKDCVMFDCDWSVWYFPICFKYDTVGNNHHPWTFEIGFLCFRLIFCLHEDTKAPKE